MCYRCNTMKRPGRTETLSISMLPEPLKLLRRRAKQAHGGNLSAAIAEAAEFLRRDLAMQELIVELVKEHGPLTDAERKELGLELSAATSALRRKRKRAA